MLGVEPLSSTSKCDKSFKSETDAAYATYFRFYVVFLKDEKNCDLIYGRQRYDYQKDRLSVLHRDKSLE